MLMHEARSRHTRDSVEQPLRAAAIHVRFTEVRTDQPHQPNPSSRYSKIERNGGGTVRWGLHRHRSHPSLLSLLFTLHSYRQEASRWRAGGIWGFWRGARASFEELATPHMAWDAARTYDGRLLR